MLNKKEHIAQLIAFDQALHNWGRFIGRVGKLYIPQQADDSNTNFIWNAATQQLEGREFKTQTNSCFIAYSVKDLGFHFIDKKTKTILHSIYTNDMEYQNIIAQFEGILIQLGLDSTHFQNGLQFRFPERFYKENTANNLLDEIKNLWMALRTGANINLGKMLVQINKTSEIRIWTTNFDTGVFCQYANNMEQYAGFSPADEVSNVPYFYNSLFKNSMRVVPGNSFKLDYGYWEIEKWKGAVLPITTFKNIDTLLNNASHFLIQSTNLLLAKTHQ